MIVCLYILQLYTVVYVFVRHFRSTQEVVKILTILRRVSRVYRQDFSPCQSTPEVVDIENGKPCYFCAISV